MFSLRTFSLNWIMLAWFKLFSIRSILAISFENPFSLFQFDSNNFSTSFCWDFNLFERLVVYYSPDFDINLFFLILSKTNYSNFYDFCKNGFVMGCYNSKILYGCDSIFIPRSSSPYNSIDYEYLTSLSLFFGLYTSLTFSFFI